MPTAERPTVLKAVYDETVRLIRAWELPTRLITSDSTLYRAIDMEYFTPTTRGIFPRQQANLCLLVRDEFHDANRFSGQSRIAGVPCWGGLYCSVQQQALVNEILYYVRLQTRNDPKTKGKVPVPITRDPSTGFPNPHAALNRKFIIKIRLSTSFMAADLSPHNPRALHFVQLLEQSNEVQSILRITRSLPKPLWEQMVDPFDCSVARGIGLAVASSSAMHGLISQSVRPSDRSVDETGDNVVFFGRNDERISGLWVEEAYVFPVKDEIMVYPIEA